MISLLIKQFLRSKGLVTGLVFLFFIGLMSLYIGKSFTQKQTSIINQSAHSQAEQIQRHLEHADSHIGLLLYYIRFGIANEVPALSGLSIGHRDFRLAAQLVNIRNLEEQKNTNELTNPFYQLLGTMDFSFVLIFLFPLMIIGMCFNLWSEEKESGRWPLIYSQSSRPTALIDRKIAIRFVSITCLLIAILVIAKFYLNIPINQQFLAFSLISILYTSFWFSLCYWITSLDRSSNQSALILLSIWILLTILIPALLNNAIHYFIPIPEAYETTIDSRDGYHNKWDLPKEPTIDQFKKQYPQFSEYEHPKEESFSWFWYYAMQQMGDNEASTARASMKEKLNKRNRWSQILGMFIPSIHSQFSLNALAKTDMTNYLDFLESLEQFHEEKRLYFYPKIFDNEPVKNENWDGFELSYYEDKRTARWETLIPLVLLCGIFFFLAHRKLMNSQVEN